MKKIVLATQKILKKESSVANMSYTKGDGDLIIMFSHSSVNVVGEFSYTTWEQMQALFPAISNLTFERDKDIVHF